MKTKQIQRIQTNQCLSNNSEEKKLKSTYLDKMENQIFKYGDLDQRNSMSAQDYRN